MMGRRDSESLNSSVNFPEKRTREEFRDVDEFTREGQRRTLRKLRGQYHPSELLSNPRELEAGEKLNQTLLTWLVERT